MKLLPALLFLAVFLGGCAHRSEGPEIAFAATAEGLVGTTWQLEGLSVEFAAPPKLTISGKGTPFGEPLVGEFVVHDGIIEISAAGHTRAGTWDGRSMVIDGMDARFVSKT